MGVQVLAGTRKGLFVLTSQDRRSWELEGPLLPPGRDGEDGRLWLGGTPGVLFRSEPHSRQMPRLCKPGVVLGLLEDRNRALALAVEPRDRSPLWICMGLQESKTQDLTFKATLDVDDDNRALAVVHHLKDEELKALVLREVPKF